MKPLHKFAFAAVALAALAPSPLFACAACYGKTDAPLASGMNAGIFTMLGVIVVIFTCIISFFVHVVRKESSSNQSPQEPQNSDPKNPTNV